MKTTGSDFSYEAVTELRIFGGTTIQTQLEMKQEAAETSISIPDGEAVNAFAADEKTMNTVQKQVTTNLTGVLFKLMLDQELKQDIQILLGTGN